MAPGVDQAAGWGLVSLAGFIFTYYSIWVIILVYLLGLISTLQPFVDPDQPIHSYFLPRVYAIAAPLLAGVVALFLIACFILYVTVAPKKEKKS